MKIAGGGVKVQSTYVHSPASLTQEKGPTVDPPRGGGVKVLNLLFLFYASAVKVGIVSNSLLMQ